MFPKWVFLGAEETVPVGFCSFILSSGYSYAPSPWLICIFHFPLIRIGVWAEQWLTRPLSSLCLSLVVWGVWWEGGKRRRERGLPPFSLPITPCLRHLHYAKTTGDKSDAVVVHLPPTNVTQVQIPVSMPHVGWVCCWFSPLLREVFLWVLWFSPLLKNQHFQIPFRSRMQGHF